MIYDGISLKYTNPLILTLLVVPFTLRKARRDPETWRRNLVTLLVPLKELGKGLDLSCIIFS